MSHAVALSLTDIAGTSWGAGRVDLFARGVDNNHLYHRTETNNSWSAWEDLGGSVVSIPSPVTWGSGRLDVFVLGSDQHIHQITYSGNKWGAWQDVGGPWGSAPGALTFGANSFDLFVKGPGPDAGLHQVAYRNGVWTPYALLGLITSAPFAITTSATQGYGIIRGIDGQFSHVSITEPHALIPPIWPFGWIAIGPFAQIAEGGVATGVTSAGRTDLFGVSNSGTLLHATFLGALWSAWEDLGAFPSRPAAVSTSANEIELYTIGGTGHLSRKKWTSAAGWGANADLGV